MKAIAVSEYGAIDNLVAIDLPKPSNPEGHDLLIQVKAASINPIDTKVRAGTYDDYPGESPSPPLSSSCAASTPCRTSRALTSPSTRECNRIPPRRKTQPLPTLTDYYSRAPPLPQTLGFDGSGLVLAAGPSATHFSAGDEVYYSGSPIRPGSNAEYQLVDSRAVALKPKNLSFAQAAAMPLTWITAHEALIERLGIRPGIQPGEQSGILIVNGAGGVGEMGATHVVNHREDVVKQVRELELDVPLKYVFITHTPTSGYVRDAAAVYAPFGKVCSIVQDREMPMYGTEFLAKSLTFVWELLGTKPYYGVDVEDHGKMLKELVRWLEEGKVKCHLKEVLPFTLEGVKKAHEMVEKSGVVGKAALSVDASDLGQEQAFQ